ncbi:MAG: glycosyltransferase family 2 protein [Chitinophagaceae bacterium]
MKDNKELSFSVIIPLYNKAKFIEIALISLLSQELLPDEIIIVEDCSNDNSYEVANNFIERSELKHLFRLVRNRENSGPGITRNYGIQQAKSDYLIFLDADDRLDSKHIYNLEKCIKLTQAKLLVTRVKYSRSNTILPSLMIDKYCNTQNPSCYIITNPFKAMEYESIFVSANYCFNAVFFKGFLFSSERNFEDWKFCYGMLKKLANDGKQIYLIPHATYQYTEDDPSSLSSGNITDLSQVCIPSIYFDLEKDGECGIRKLIFSIWAFNVIKRLSSIKYKIKFIRIYKNFIYENFIINKYYLGIFLLFLLPSKSIQRTIDFIKSIFR